MKREGHQHGVVRSYIIHPTTFSQRRYVKTVDSASVSGLFAKVSRKPTNQSKFTGKCGKPRCSDCHVHPVTKSKDKAKGTMKLRSIGSDPDLISSLTGTSATEALAYLLTDGWYDEDYGYEDALMWLYCTCVNCLGPDWEEGQEDSGVDLLLDLRVDLALQERSYIQGKI